MYNFGTTGNTSFQQNIHSSVRTLNAIAQIYNENKELVTTFNKNDYIKSIEIQRIGNNNFFGSVISQRLNIKLLKPLTGIDLHAGQFVKPYIGIKSPSYLVPYPMFKISEIHKDEETEELSITAYDYIYGAEKKPIKPIIDALNEEVEAGTRSKYNLRDILSRAAQSIGCDQVDGVYYKSINRAQDILAGIATNASDIASGFNITTKLINLEGTETIRDFLNWCAELFLGVIYIQHNGLIAIKRLLPDNTVEETLEKADYITLDTKTNRRLVGLCKTTELGNNIEAKLSQTGTIYYIRNNPFLETPTDTQVSNFLNSRLNEVQLLTINQFDSEWFGNPRLEFGDRIAFKDKEGNTLYNFVLNDTITFDGAIRQKTQWKYDEEEETEANPSTLGELLNKTYAKVDKANKRIDLVVGEVTVVSGKADTAISTANGAQTTAVSAQSTATSAQTTATSANTKAVNAESLANGAGVQASLAQSMARLAQDSADFAQSSADAAQSTADSAQSTATSAQTTANTAQTTANTAQTTANTASATATNAKNTADNAQTTADAAQVSADGAQNSANEANTNASNAQAAADEAIATAEEAKEKAEAVDTSVQVIQTNFTAIEQTTRDITLSVNQILEDGVNKVETSMGYKFDDSGLNITKTDSELSTTINEDGMKVKRNNVEMLVANNQGVDAVNLHAKTYLIIGNNSRFEDYELNNQPYTACFWIGG